MDKFNNIIHMPSSNTNKDCEQYESVWYENYITELQEFSECTKLMRMQIEKKLNEGLHRRIEVLCSRTGISDYSFYIHVFDFNNLDYESIGVSYEPELSATEYVNTVLSAYNNPELKQKYIFKMELTSNEKVFIVWLQSTNMDKYYSLSPEGVICTELEQVGFPKYEYNEVYIQDFSMTFEDNVCTLFNEYEKYILTNKKIEKVN